MVLKRRQKNRPNTKRTQSKSKGKGNKKGKGGGGYPIMSTIGKGLGAALRAALPGMIRAVMPFPTSGSYAMASPGLGTDAALSAPSANGTLMRTTKAIIDTNSDGITVRHREYIGDILPEGGIDGPFQLLYANAINPASQTLFPWLSGIVNRYESYSFRMLKFIYEPQCATVNTGTVMMAVDFDVSDDEPQSKVQMMSYKGAVRSPPWFACVNMSSSQDLSRQKSFFVEQKAGSESRLSNVGNFFLAYEGTETVTLGELYVEYEVRLTTPHLDGSSGISTTFFTYAEATPTVYGIGSALWSTIGLPGTFSQIGNCNAFITQMSTTPNITTLALTFPTAGTYLVCSKMIGQIATASFTILPSLPSGAQVVLSTSFFEQADTISTADGSLFVALTTSTNEQFINLELVSSIGQTGTVQFLLSVTELPTSAVVPTFFPEHSIGFTTLALRQRKIKEKWLLSETSKKLSKTAPAVLLQNPPGAVKPSVSGFRFKEFGKLRNESCCSFCDRLIEDHTFPCECESPCGSQKGKGK